MGIRVALAGNPNSGKTTLFNALTGASQYVGNWPGVTVEKKEGKYTHDKDVAITDLPGIYSLSPYSPEEIVSRDYLLGGDPNLVINVVDATNLERNLYLTTQFLDLGIPVVIALNMMDLVEKDDIKIDIEKLSRDLGCSVVQVSALRNKGIEELMKVATEVVEADLCPAPLVKLSASVEDAISQISELIRNNVPERSLRWYAIKLFENEDKTLNELNLSDAITKKIDDIREKVETDQDDDAESLVTADRYNEITKTVGDSVKMSSKGLSRTQKIDKVVTNRLLGLPIFIAIMVFVYWIAVSWVGTIATDWANDGVFGDGWHYAGGEQYEEAEEEYLAHALIAETYLEAAEEAGLDTEAFVEASEAEEPTAADEAAIEGFMAEAQAANITAEIEDEEGAVSTITYSSFENALEQEEPDPANYGLWVPGIPVVLGDWLESMGTAPWLQSLILDGIVGGVGAVLGFVPQMIILFLLLSLLEACGYMARVAFLMDRIFRRFGLSGKSFIPMLIASGCGVPAIMATKTIENEKDRRMTVMTTTFIPCGAKLPIIALVFGAIAGGDPATTWWVAPLFYFLGVIAVILSGIMLRKTKMFAGEATPFVMELPQYHLPSLKGVLLTTWERVKAFIVRAGTVIFISSIVIWFLLNFGIVDGAFAMLDAEEPNYIADSFMAYIGNAFAWLFMPLGFGNWESAVTTITGLVAKENVVSTLAIITNLGEAGEGDLSMWTAFAALLGGSIPAIMAFCAFNLLCAPCFAAIGTISNQMRSAKWTWFAIGYQTVFAWCVALMIYQFGGLILGEFGFNVWTGVACLVAGALLVQLLRPTPTFKNTDKTAFISQESGVSGEGSAA